MKRLTFALCAALFLMFVAADLISAQDRQRNPPSGSGGGGQQAVPRNVGQSRPSGPPPSAGQSRPSSPPPSSRPPSGGSAVARGAGSSGGQAGQAGVRPRGDSGSHGQAVPRSSVPGGGQAYYPRDRYSYVSPWLYYSPYAYSAFGLGYWGFDPYWWDGWGYYRSPYYSGWGYPYGYGYGDGYGYGYGDGGGYGDYGYRSGYGAGGGYGYPSGGGSYRDYGSLKLKIKPLEAEVYVDGYYMGQVDDFDGVFQHLELEAGTHRIEIRAVGYQPLRFDVRVTPGRTISYTGDLRPGEPIR